MRRAGYRERVEASPISFESHIEDTLRAGAGLCDRTAVEAIVRDGPEAVRELIALGNAIHAD